MYSDSADASTREAQRSQLIDDAGVMGTSLSAAQADQLVRYVELIAKWNKVYNLTAVRDPADMRLLHLNDSLGVIQPLRRMLSSADVSIADVGSGAGLPGVVMAIAAAPKLVTCIDTVGKKSSFVQQVAADLALNNLKSMHARVESVQAPPGYEVITSRAFASLKDFVHLTRHLLVPGGIWMALKGKVPTAELSELPSSVEVFHVEQLNIVGLNAERCIVWMKVKAD